MDSEYLRKGETIRQRSRKLNWQQLLDTNNHNFSRSYMILQYLTCLLLDFPDHFVRTLEHELKEMRVLQEDEVIEGQKGSRMSKWIANAKREFDSRGVAAPEKLQTLAFSQYHDNIQITSDNI